MRHLPTFVSVEPANYCQLRCPECPVGMASSPNRLMTIALFQRVLDNVQATAHTMQFYFQGEPLLNRQLPAMITMAHQVGLYTIVSTNAQALSRNMAEALVKSGLNHIIVSIDGFSDESYAAYRVGGSLPKAREGLKHLANAKAEHHSRIRIELQVLRLRSNEHEWQWVEHNYKKLGATHLVFKTAQLNDFEHGNPLMPTDEHYARYHKTADGTYVHKKRRIQHSKFPIHHSPCLRLWSGCVITTNGDVLPCCYDKEHKHILGNITAQPLTEIFHSKKALSLRRLILQGHHLPDMCKNCDK